MTKLLKTWNDDVKVGIWEDDWELKLCDDMAILKMPYIKWRNNSASLAKHVMKFYKDDKQFKDFMRIAKEEQKDGEDYTDKIKELIWKY